MQKIAAKDNKYKLNSQQKHKSSKGQKLTKAFVNISSQKEQVIRCDLALEDFKDLIDPKFKNWFCKAYYILGEAVMRKIAAEVRVEATKNSRGLFGWSIKKELLKKKMSKNP